MVRFGVIFTLICFCAAVLGVEIVNTMLTHQKCPKSQPVDDDIIDTVGEFICKIKDKLK